MPILALFILLLIGYLALGASGLKIARRLNLQGIFWGIIAANTAIIVCIVTSLVVVDWTVVAFNPWVTRDTIVYRGTIATVLVLALVSMYLSFGAREHQQRQMFRPPAEKNSGQQKAVEATSDSAPSAESEASQP